MLGSRSEPMQSSITACSTGQSSANHLHHRGDVVQRINEGYRVWGALKSVLNNTGLSNCSISGRCAFALVLLALQHSHIALEVTYIPINNIYIYIYIYLPFGIIDWLGSLELVY